MSTTYIPKPASTEWPMEAVVYEYVTRDGAAPYWRRHAVIRSIELGEIWISKRENPENWKVVPRTAELTRDDEGRTI